jgi:hypothetical protein
LFQSAGYQWHPGELIGDAPIDLEVGGATHAGNFTVSDPVCDPALLGRATAAV